MANETVAVTISVVRPDANHVLALVRGPLSWDSHSKLGEQLDMASGFGWRRKPLVLDLSGVSFIDSSGISSMLTFHREMTGTGGQLILCQVPVRVDQTFRLVGLARIIPVVGTSEDARHLLTARQSGEKNIFTTDEQQVFTNNQSQR